MNKSFIGQYVDKKGRLVIYSRADGGGSVAVEKEDAGEVILWLASFQQGVQPTLLESPRPEVESMLPQSGSRKPLAGFRQKE